MGYVVYKQVRSLSLLKRLPNDSAILWTGWGYCEQGEDANLLRCFEQARMLRTQKNTVNRRECSKKLTIRNCRLVNRRSMADCFYKVMKIIKNFNWGWCLQTAEEVHAMSVNPKNLIRSTFGFQIGFLLQRLYYEVNTKVLLQSLPTSELFKTHRLNGWREHRDFWFEGRLERVSWLSKPGKLLSSAEFGSPSSRVKLSIRPNLFSRCLRRRSGDFSKKPSENPARKYCNYLIY